MTGPLPATEPSNSGDRVHGFWRRLRRSRAGAAVLIVGAVVTGVGGVVAALRVIFPKEAGLELVDITVINEPDGVAAFRRTWFADTQAARDGPTWSRPDSLIAMYDSARTSPEAIRALVQLTEADRRAWYEGAGKGTGLLPIIDLKFRNTASSAAFLTRIELQGRRRTYSGPVAHMCGVTTPSWEYNVLLNPAKRWQRVALEISQSVEANSVDRFIVVVGSGGLGWADFEVDLTLHYNAGERLRLGKARISVRGASCGGIHSLDSLRRVGPRPAVL